MGARANGLAAATPTRRSILAASDRSPRSRRRAAAARGPLEIVNPPAGATYLIDPTLRREFQTLPLRVVTAAPGPIEWTINERALGSSSSDAALDWPLAPGTHRISARDGRGNVAEASVVVK